jgi:hypothetical protein
MKTELELQKELKEIIDVQPICNYSREYFWNIARKLPKIPFFRCPKDYKPCSPLFRVVDSSSIKN